MSNSFKKIISSSGINFVFRIFSLLTSFFTLKIISNLFGMDVLGNYTIAFTISQATAMIFALGVPITLVRLVGNNNLTFLQAKKVLIKGLKVTAAFALLPILFFWLGADFISHTIFEKEHLENYFLIVTLSLPLFIFHELFLYFFIAVKKFKQYNIFMFVLPNLLLLLFLFVFYYIEMPGYYAFLAFACSIVIVVAAEAIMIFELNPKKEVSIVSSKQLIKTAFPLMFSGLMLYLLNWTDVIILGTMVSEEQVGIYNIAFKVGSVGFLVIVSVNTIIMPKMAELYGQKRHEELKKLIQSSTRLIAVLSVPVVIGLVVLSDFILSLFDEGAIQGKTTMMIIAAGVLFSAICGNTDQILNMTNNEKLLRTITVLCFFLNIVLNYVFIPHYGINGAAIASLITNVVLNIISLYYVKKKLGFYTLA